jgi:hypothetical protein
MESIARVRDRTRAVVTMYLGSSRGRMRIRPRGSPDGWDVSSKARSPLDVVCFPFEAAQQSHRPTRTFPQKVPSADHITDSLFDSLRLEIPCIYQKVGAPSKKRKRRKDSNSAEDDAEGEDDAPADADPEIAKAKEKPFYSLIEQASLNNGTADENYVQGSLNSGYQLPFHPGDGFSLDLGTGMEQMLGNLGGMPSGDGMASYPMMEANNNIQRPTDNPLAVFSQLLGINNPFPENHTNSQSRQGQTPQIPSPTWPRDAHLLTPSQPTLDIVFCPASSRRGASFHKSPDEQSGITPVVQDGLEEGTSLIPLARDRC